MRAERIQAGRNAIAVLEDPLATLEFPSVRILISQTHTKRSFSGDRGIRKVHG